MAQQLPIGKQSPYLDGNSTSVTREQQQQQISSHSHSHSQPQPQPPQQAITYSLLANLPFASPSSSSPAASASSSSMLANPTLPHWGHASEVTHPHNVDHSRQFASTMPSSASASAAYNAGHLGGHGFATESTSQSHAVTAAGAQQYFAGEPSSAAIERSNSNPLAWYNTSAYPYVDVARRPSANVPSQQRTLSIGDPTTPHQVSAAASSHPGSTPLRKRSRSPSREPAAAATASAGPLTTQNGDVPAGTAKIVEKEGALITVFQCRGFGDCDMTFTRSEHLARHIRKHTGERPFQCHCGKSFSRLDNLRQHAQTVHSEEADRNEAMMRDLTDLHANLAASAAHAQAAHAIVVAKTDPAALAAIGPATKKLKTTKAGSVSGPASGPGRKASRKLSGRKDSTPGQNGTSVASDSLEHDRRFSEATSDGRRGSMIDPFAMQYSSDGYAYPVQFDAAAAAAGYHRPSDAGPFAYSAADPTSQMANVASSDGYAAPQSNFNAATRASYGYGDFGSQATAAAAAGYPRYTASNANPFTGYEQYAENALIGNHAQAAFPATSPPPLAPQASDSSWSRRRSSLASAVSPSRRMSSLRDPTLPASTGLTDQYRLTATQLRSSSLASAHPLSPRGSTGNAADRPTTSQAERPVLPPLESLSRPGTSSGSLAPLQSPSAALGSRRPGSSSGWGLESFSRPQTGSGNLDKAFRFRRRNSMLDLPEMALDQSRPGTGYSFGGMPPPEGAPPSSRSGRSKTDFAFDSFLQERSVRPLSSSGRLGSSSGLSALGDPLRTPSTAYGGGGGDGERGGRLNSLGELRTSPTMASPFQFQPPPLASSSSTSNKEHSAAATFFRDRPLSSYNRRYGSASSRAVTRDGLMAGESTYGHEGIDGERGAIRPLSSSSAPRRGSDGAPLALPSPARSNGADSVGGRGATSARRPFTSGDLPTPPTFGSTPREGRTPAKEEHEHEKEQEREQS